MVFSSCRSSKEMVNLRMTSRSMQTEPVQVSHLTYLCSLNHSLICHSGFSCRKLILSTHTPFDMLCGHASSCGAPSVLRGTHPPAGHTSSSGPHIPLWGTQYPAGHTSFCGAHILLHGTHPPVRLTSSCEAHTLLRGAQPSALLPLKTSMLSRDIYDWV